MDPKDPGNPRRENQYPPERRGGEFGDSDLGGPNFGGMVRGMWVTLSGLCLVGTLILLCVGVSLAISVFRHVGQIAVEPQHAQPSVDAIATMIDADAIQITPHPNAEPVPVGRAVAFILLVLLYWLWAWIPLALMYRCARILLAGVSRKPDP